jgi:hypothetical protein
VVKTDHYSLKYLLDQRLSTIPQHQWVSKLLGFDFRVQYKPGASNTVDDALSGRDTEEGGELAVLSASTFQVFTDLRNEFTNTPELRELLQAVTAGGCGDKWRVVDGLVMVNGCVYIPPTSPSVSVILDSAHGTGHEGVEKTLHRLRVDFHLPGSRRLVQEFVRACMVCQCNKTEHLHPTGLLQPLEVRTPVLTDITMDFIEGFPCINGKSVILTIVDWFSKYSHFIALGHPYTATIVARTFFNNIMCLHGLPSSIVSDRDPVFTSQFWKELFQLAGVKLNFSSAFHPQSNG